MEGRSLRPLGVGEIVDTAINLYYRNLAAFAKIAAVIAIPMGVIIFLLDQIAFSEPRGSSTWVGSVGEYSQAIDYSTFVTATVAKELVVAFGILLVIGGSFRAVSDAYIGDEASTSESIRFAVGRFPSVLWVGSLYILGVIAASFAFLLPGIWLLVAWSLAIPALLAENLKGTKALGRSFDLVRDRWWRTFGAILVGLIFIALLQFLIGIAAAGVTSLTEDSKHLSLLINDAGRAVALIITGPLQAAVVAVIYYDLRVRKEDFGIDALTQQLEEPGSAPPAPEPPPGESPNPPPPPPSTPSGW